MAFQHHGQKTGTHQCGEGRTQDPDPEMTRPRHRDAERREGFGCARAERGRCERDATWGERGERHTWDDDGISKVVEE